MVVLTILLHLCIVSGRLVGSGAGDGAGGDVQLTIDGINIEPVEDVFLAVLFMQKGAEKGAIRLFSEDVMQLVCRCCAFFRR